MKSTSINGRSVSPRRPTQLVSRTAILILSGVLIGTAVGQGVPTGIHVHCLCAGVVGLISFIGLDYLAERRRIATTRRVLERSRRKLASRIDRHVVKTRFRHAKRPYRSRRTAESSYLTVTTA